MPRDGRGIRLASPRSSARKRRPRGPCRAGRAMAPTSSTRPRSMTAAWNASLLAAAAHLLGEFKIHGANPARSWKGQGHQDLHCDVPKYFLDDCGGERHPVVRRHDARERPDAVGAGPASPADQHSLRQYRRLEAKSLSRRRSRSSVPQDFAKPYPGEIYVIGAGWLRRDPQLLALACRGRPTRAARGGVSCISPTPAATRRSSSCSGTTWTQELYERLEPGPPLPDGCGAGPGDGRAAEVGPARAGAEGAGGTERAPREGEGRPCALRLSAYLQFRMGSQ